MKPSEFFGYNDYKILLSSIIHSKPRRGYGQLHRLGNHLKVHSSLVSQVLSGPKDFTPEQALKVAEFFQFTSKETDYLLLLVHLARAGTDDLRKFYRNQVAGFQANQLQVTSRISGDTKLNEADQAIYYSDWTYMAVWISTTFKKPKTPAEIAATLGIELKEVERILKFLVRANLCIDSPKGYIGAVNKTHIPASSPLSRRHHINWRLKAIERAPNLNSEEMMFTAPISLSAVDLKWLKRQLLDLIQEASEVVKKSRPEEIACLNIDLIRV